MNSKSTLSFLFASTLCANLSSAQTANSATRQQLSRHTNSRGSEDRPPFFYVGLGAGLDYGGIGMKAEILPVKFVGLFAGIGYNLATIGYNAGVSVKVLPNKNATPVLVGMYGYNGVLIIKNAYTDQVESKEVYYGFTPGAGFEGRTGREKRNKFSILVFYPLREQFEKDADKVGANYIPIAVSAGFSFGI